MSGCQIGWCRFLHKRAESCAGAEFLCLAACWPAACWPSHAYLSFLAISPAWDLEAGRPTAVKNILLSPGLGLIRGYTLPRLWAGAGKDGAGKVKKTVDFRTFWRKTSVSRKQFCTL